MSVACTQSPISGSSSSLRFPNPDDGQGGGDDFWTGRDDTINSPDEFRGNQFRPIGRMDSEGPTNPPLLNIRDEAISNKILKLSLLDVKLSLLTADLSFGEVRQRNLVEELDSANRSATPDIPELSRLEQFLLEHTLTKLPEQLDYALKGQQILVGAIDPADLCKAADFNDLIDRLTCGFENWESVAAELERRSTGWNEPDVAQKKEMIDRGLRAFGDLGESVTMDRFKLVYPFVGLFSNLSETDRASVIELMLNDKVPFNYENHRNWVGAIRERQ